MLVKNFVSALAVIDNVKNIVKIIAFLMPKSLLTERECKF